MLKVHAVAHDLTYLRDPKDPEKGRFIEIVKPVDGYDFPTGIETFERETTGMLEDLSRDLTARLAEILPADDFVLIFDSSHTAKGRNACAGANDPFSDAWALIATCAEVVRARAGNRMYLHAWCDVESLAPNFVVEMRNRGQLKLHAYWGRARFLAKNVIDCRNLLPVEDHGRTFERKDVSWKLSYAKAATMEAQELRDALHAHFLKHVNPKLADAVLVDGEDDALIADSELEVVTGTPEEFRQAMQHLIDAWPVDTSELVIRCVGDGPMASYGETNLSAFVEDIVLPIVQPHGFGYSYNDGPSMCKSGYTYGALHIRVTRGTVSAHEAIESRSKFCGWLGALGVQNPSDVLESYENRPSN